MKYTILRYMTYLTSTISVLYILSLIYALLALLTHRHNPPGMVVASVIILFGWWLVIASFFFALGYKGYQTKNNTLTSTTQILYQIDRVAAILVPIMFVVAVIGGLNAG